jgi:hypothetical protein
MALYRGNPGAGKFVADAWGWIGRDDWGEHPDRSGFYGIPGSSEMQPGSGQNEEILDPSQGNFFDSAEAAVASLGPRPGRTMSQNAYSASLAAQGIPESELPYNSGQLRTFLAQAGRGLPVAGYLQNWAKNTPGAWGQLAGRMMNERPPALQKILADKQDPATWTAERQRAALIEYLMRQYGGSANTAPSNVA